MANQNAAQSTTPSAQPTPANEANAPAQNILDDVCVIEGEKAENTHTLERPPLGETREVELQDGQNYIFGFAKGDVKSFTEDKDGTLTITFDCGGKLVLKNYGEVVKGDEASTFAFSDVIPQGELSSLIKVVDTTEEKQEPENTAKHEKHAKNATGENVANIEPAAGDESTNAKKLAQIEPAAGDGGGAGGHGYGFNSSYETTPVGPLNPVGPLGATSLQYNANFRQPNPLEGQDSSPTAEGPAEKFIDETNLSGGPIVEHGFVTFDFGADGPGSLSAAGAFAPSGSMLAGNLTSNGNPVTMNITANGYEGVANGNTVFTLTIDPNTGEYVFTLLGALDHADPTDPNDVIDLQFGVNVTDVDGDNIVTNIIIHVADANPEISGDGVKTVDEHNLSPTSVNGDLIENYSSDGQGNIHPNGTTSASGDLAGGVLSSGGHAVTITQTANGYEGVANGSTVFTLTIDPATGAYTFTLLGALDHSVGGDTILLNFGAQIVDYDGDTADANITIKVIDDVPHINDDKPTVGHGIENIDETNLGPIVVNGSISVSGGADTPTTLTPDGNYSTSGSMTGGTLSSHGVPVTITQTANGYEGKAGGVTVFTFTIDNSGHYTFTQIEQLDHADGNNPNDIISLQFGVKVTDNDGDTDSGFVTVNIADDVPTIANDGLKVIAEKDIPGVVNGDLIENFGQDGQGNIHTTGTWSATGDLANGTLSSNGVAVVVTSTANGYVGTANGQQVFTLTIDPTTGAYTFNLLKSLDNSVGGNQITLHFGTEIVDYDGDTAQANIDIKITDDVPEIDDKNPTVGNGLEVVDETNLGPIVRDGHINVDYGSDTPGTLTANGTVTSTYPLTSHGTAVAITSTATGYTGTANGQTIFTLTVASDGTYHYTQFGVIDHADPNNPDDINTVHFGITATDSDGDTDTGSITVQIHDDAPSLTSDGIKVVDEKDITTSVHGDLVENYGHDGAGNIHTTGTWTATGDVATGTLRSGGVAVVVTSTATGYVGTANGQQVFTLTIDPSTGAYTFNLLKALDHTVGGNAIVLNFGAEIVDYDGDKAQAPIQIKVLDDTPHFDNGQPTIGHGLEVVDETNLGPIVRNGAVTVDFGSDTPGTVTTNGTFTSSYPLTSHGTAVAITSTPTGYAGTANGQTIFTLTINPNGSYTYTQIGVVDHANPADPDDVVTVNFGIKVTDADGDTANGQVSVQIHDDGPKAVDDGNFTDGNTVTGNVLTNDDPGKDGLGSVISVQFGGNTFVVPSVGQATVVGAHGTLKISANGDYTYTPNNGTDGNDEFKYTMKDYDGDTSSAKLKITVDNDDHPIIVKPATEVVDETNLGPIVETGHVDANYFGDGPGAITTTGSFSSSGSKLGGNLTSHGVAVQVTSTATGYVGTANGNEVFKITVQPNGDYTFTLTGVLDHADGSNPNDVITLNFGVKATDADGDTAETSITVNVLDDAPVAHDDTNIGEGVRTGNVVTGANGGAGAADTLSHDTNNTVTKISFGGTTVDVPAVGQATINGQYGQLKISADGSYTYTPFAASYAGGDTVHTMNPASSNFTGVNSTVAKNGITVHSSNNADLTWNTTGKGIAIGTDGIEGNEKLQISFDASDKVTVTLATLCSDGGGVDYVVHLANGTTVTGEFDLEHNSNQDGVGSFTLNSSSFGGVEITGVDVYSIDNSAQKTTSFVVQNVTISSHDCPPDQGQDQFTYTLRDGDGDTSTAKLTVEGDQPVLVVGENVDDKTGSKTEHHIGCDHGDIIGKKGADILVGDVGGSKQVNQVKDYNVVLILDISGSMGEGPGSKLQLLKDAVSHLLQDFNNYDTGSIKVHVVPFGTTAFGEGTFDVTTAQGYADAVAFVQGMDNNGAQFTNYEAPMAAALNWLNGASSNDPIAGASTYTYFVSDGEPNRYVNNSGNTVEGNADTVMNQIHGSDGSDEVAGLQAHGEVIGIGIGVNSTTLGRLDTIDSHGNALDVQDANDLDSVFQNLNPLNKPSAVGGDTLTGGDGNDIIFGDSVYTDILAAAQHLTTKPGAGWEVFDQLEAGLGTNAGWTRADTIDYIKSHTVELSAESLSSTGEHRTGGNDIISGGNGNDIIFGQEGRDVITGGAGNDTIYGGSGDDVFKYVGNDGHDTIKDFHVGDILDVSGLLQGYDPVQDSINDFVFKTESAGNTTIYVNDNGVGGMAGAHAIATLEGVTGLDIEQITNDGKTVVV